MASQRGSMEKANTMDYSNWNDPSSSQIVHPKLAHHDGLELELSSCDSPLQNPMLKPVDSKPDLPIKPTLVNSSSQINYGPSMIMNITQDDDIQNADKQLLDASARVSSREL
mmetsp:Transcript_13128/g.20394  ORF Transcript_13128/g.20394 Transcript_13128/m.20394 type:complete len:112 (-) Transcript_13128:3077-3412(-)